MNEILLITTQGCAGCNIMYKLILQAVDQSSKKISVLRRLHTDLDRHWLSEHDIKDFPTTVFKKNGDVRFKTVGTNPVPVIVRWIDIYFK